MRFVDLSHSWTAGGNKSWFLQNVSAALFVGKLLAFLLAFRAVLEFLGHISCPKHGPSEFVQIQQQYAKPSLSALVPESVWAQGSSNSGGLYLIFSSSHLLIFTPSHLHIFSHTFSSSHLLSHLLIFTSSLTPSHLHIFSHTFSSSHLLIFTPSLTPSHLHICSSSHLLIFTSSDLHTFSSSHLLLFTPSLTPSHLHTFSSSHLLSHLLIFTSSLSLTLSPLSSLLSLSLFSLSPSLSFSL